MIKKIVEEVQEYFDARPYTVLALSAVFFALSIFIYRTSTVFLSESEKLSTIAEMSIVLGAFMLLTISGLLFLGLLSRTIGRLLKRFFIWCYEKIRKSIARTKQQ